MVRYLGMQIFFVVTAPLVAQQLPQSSPVAQKRPLPTILKRRYSSLVEKLKKVDELTPKLNKEMDSLAFLLRKFGHSDEAAAIDAERARITYDYFKNIAKEYPDPYERCYAQLNLALLELYNFSNLSSAKEYAQAVAQQEEFKDLRVEAEELLARIRIIESKTAHKSVTMQQQEKKS
jgi:hypothetical protein